MDGSGETTVVLLNNPNIDYTFVFTMDYSRQMLYWMNGSNSCYYTNYIESSSINGSGRRTFYDTSHHYTSYLCYYGYYRRTQAIDFFGGAIYSYSRYLVKTEVELHSFNIIHFNYVNNYMCGSSYTGMKVISPERQLQGMRYK